MISEESRLREAAAFANIIEMLNDTRIARSSNPVVSELWSRMSQESPRFTRAELIQLVDSVNSLVDVIHAAFRYWDAGHIPDSAWRELEGDIEGATALDNLYQKIFIRHMGTMPPDFRERYGILDQSELGISLLEYIQ